MQALAKQSGIVRMPVKKMSVKNRIEAKNNEMLQQKGTRLNYDQLAEEMEMSSEEIIATMRGYSSHLSLDSPIKDEENASYLEMLASDDTASAEDKMIDESLTDEVQKAINDLNPRHRKVLQMRYGLKGEPMTLEQIGKDMSLSK